MALNHQAAGEKDGFKRGYLTLFSTNQGLPKPDAVLDMRVGALVLLSILFSLSGRMPDTYTYVNDRMNE